MTLHLTCIEAHAEGEPGRVIVDADVLAMPEGVAEPAVMNVGYSMPPAPPAPPVETTG